MNETMQAAGWWLASDGNWYPPEQSPGTPVPSAPAEAAPSVPGGLSKGTAVLIGLALVMVLGIAVVGGARLLTGGGSGSHWSSALKDSVVSGCVNDGSSKKSCGCFADELEHAGVSESELMAFGSMSSAPLVAAQSDVMSPAMKAISKCGISLDSSHSSSSVDNGFEVPGYDD
jgi:hypothetical protein